MGGAISHHPLHVDWENASSLQALQAPVSLPRVPVASAFLGSVPTPSGTDRKLVKALDWAWYPGMDAEKAMSSVDISHKAKHPGTDAFSADPNRIQDLEEYDDEMRIRAKALLDDHGFPASVPGIPPVQGGNQVWRCVPMDQIDLGGVEVAKQSGAAMYGMKAQPDGKVALEVPKRPPIFNPLGRKDAPSIHVKGIDNAFRQVLRDPADNWYWVMTATGEPARSQKHLLKTEQGPIEQPVGSTMMCHEGKQKWDVPVLAPGLFELEKQATTFLEVATPVQLSRGRGVS